MIRDELDRIKQEAMESLGKAETLEILNDVRVGVLGKKGKLTGILKSM